MSYKLNQFTSQKKLIKDFANQIIANLQQAITVNDKAVLFVSGGNTPKALFTYLSNIDLQWEKVFVSLVDERWVDESHNDSNAKLVKGFFLQNKAKKANFVPVYKQNANLEETTQYFNEQIEQLLSPCDVLILGMGEDSHTASIFPNNPRTKEALNTQNNCIWIEPTNAPHARISLSLNTILKANNIYLHIEGKKKQEVFDKAILETEDFIHSPISAVLQNKLKKIEVYYNE